MKTTHRERVPKAQCERKKEKMLSICTILAPPVALARPKGAVGA